MGSDIAMLIDPYFLYRKHFYATLFITFLSTAKFVTGSINLPLDNRLEWSKAISAIRFKTVNIIFSTIQDRRWLLLLIIFTAIFILCSMIKLENNSSSLELSLLFTLAHKVWCISPPHQEILVLGYFASSMIPVLYNSNHNSNWSSCWNVTK